MTIDHDADAEQNISVFCTMHALSVLMLTDNDKST